MAKSYFSHDADAHSNSRIIIIINRYGIAGYGMFWVMVERMRQRDNYKLPLSNVEVEALSSICRANAEQMLEVINACIELGLFIKDGDEFYSPSLMGRMKTMDEIRNKRKSAALAGVAKRKISNENSYNSANAQQVPASAEQNPANKIEIEIENKKKKVLKTSSSKRERKPKTYPITLNRETWKLQGTETIKAELADRFPRVDIDAELAKIDDWCYRKQGDAVKKKDWAAFIRNWMSSEYPKTMRAVDKPLVLDEYQLALKERLLKERQQREEAKRERLVEQEKLQEGM